VPTLLKLLTLLRPELSTDPRELPKAPLLLIAFDEAHSLAYPKTPKGKPSNPTAFSEMRRAIRQMVAFPAFALFLSTTGNIHDFTPPAKDDPSNRISSETSTLYPPFTELGFDQILKAEGFNQRQEPFDVDEVSKIGFMTRLGRPM
jgi:hypothetical protein